MKYKIVCVKERYVELVKKYPVFLKQIYQKQDNMYKTKQIELIFSSMSAEKEKLLHHIQSREDYSYYHGTHQLLNPITCQKMTMVMNEYDLDVEEEGNNHCLYDIISSFSKNFYMITK
ncbi:hypothetical protein NMU03_14400 [Allocoprobacillus halotolerans]|uniref:Uncharacterized protein n=1 Tax=Allocoprobacillus halotolerans TaxID=2944914 RepID=A0ABY5I401_9FIRM|nr:hypothetical protein [Allocoprobacillus halotolerans]UTY38773.1 hypothetical protein NMU03_14400 [Allocoprobacillus halotolerans]